MANLTRRKILSSTVAAISAAVTYPLVVNAAQADETSPSVHTVNITRLKFVPDQLNVKLGDTIIWRNHDIAPHTATASDESWDTGLIKKGETKQLVVTKEFAGDYFCRFHPHMVAGLKIT